MTDFLGSLPGYFEPDISGWFLVFITIFVGIIFGDGGYGLLDLRHIGLALMIKSRKEKKAIAPIAWLLLLFGGMTHGMGNRYLRLVRSGCGGAAGMAQKAVRAGDFQCVFG